MLFKRFKHRKESESQSIEDYLRHIIGIRTRNLEIYQIALTHRSASKESHLAKYINNERLEYLGDAVLNSIISEYLFKKYPLVNEGALTEMRSSWFVENNLIRWRERVGCVPTFRHKMGSRRNRSMEMLLRLWLGHCFWIKDIK